jgi:hypothetical protein
VGARRGNPKAIRLLAPPVFFLAALRAERNVPLARHLDGIAVLTPGGVSLCDRRSATICAVTSLNLVGEAAG